MEVTRPLDSQTYEIAAPISEKMKTDSNAADYEKFSSSFSEELKEPIIRERFESQCKEFPLLSCRSLVVEVLSHSMLRFRRSCTLSFTLSSRSGHLPAIAEPSHAFNSAK